MRMKWIWWVVAVAVAASWGAPGATAQERGDEEERLVNILEGLELMKNKQSLKVLVRP